MYSVRRLLGLVVLVVLCSVQGLQARWFNFLSKKVTDTFSSEETKKKKILIFTFNEGGYGHKAASNALEGIFAEDYNISIQDLSQYLGAGKAVGGWSIYDKALRGGWIKTINFAALRLFPMYLRMHRSDYEKKVCQLLEKEKPDLVISVISYFDSLLFSTCKQLDLPLLMVTTDGDLRNWIIGIDKKMQPAQFAAAIGFDHGPTRKLLNKVGINDEEIHYTGFPIRQDFLEEKNLEEIRATWQLPTDKFTVMISMGGAGAAATYSYAKTIAKMNLPLHLIVCTGNNKAILKKINKLKKTSSVSMTVIPFTNRISDLMAVSDVLITKPGPGIVNEAIHMNLPMIIDRTTPLLRWEEANAQLVEKEGFGSSVKKFKRLKSLLERFMNDDAYRLSFKVAMGLYKKPNFNLEIRKLVADLCPLE